MKGLPHDPAPDARLDESDPLADPLWRLLGRAPLPEPDAWFAASTLARCRHEGQAAVSKIRLAPIWRWALGGGMGLALAVILMIAQIDSIASEKADKQKKVQEAFEIMASIDTDPDSSSSPSWQDSSL